MTPRALIVSENISMKMGGESSLPFYYAKFLHARGVEVWLACHERVEVEVREAFPELHGRMRFVRDTLLQKWLFRIGGRLPYRINDLLVGQLLHISTQRRTRSVAVDLVQAGKIDVVFEPSPITPKGLSFMYDLGVPVVIGPMCGGMNFPPAFADLDSRVTRALVGWSRRLSALTHALVPGKLNASVLIAANASTERALPKGYKGRLVRLFESGVDMALWSPIEVELQKQADNAVTFVFSGRFVDWKGIKYLIQAFAKAAIEEPNCRLELIGGGELEGEILALIEARSLQSRVRMHGWVPRERAALIVRAADVFVMPSLRECGGTAILEALALGKPVITTNWGGPADYVDATCGILVDPDSQEGFVDGLASAIVRLTRDSAERSRLGTGGRSRILRDDLEWGAKADRVLGILREATKRGIR